MGHRTDKSRTEDLTTDQRANRHPTKSGNYSEEAQNVRDDNVLPVDELGDDEQDHARNKADQSSEA